MSIYNTLRAIPSNVADMLMKRGFVKDLTPEERARLDACVEAMAEELFGASAAVEVKKEKKKTKAAVVSSVPAVIDRAYLDTRTVYELKELGKDCPAIKGRKPRVELIELVLQHLSGPPVSVSTVPSPVEEASGSEEELREEAPPAPPTEKAPKEKKAKPAKEKKEKAPKEKKVKAAKKAEESPAESDDENTVELKEWFHPGEMSKPREERQRYFIDPKTNELFHPDRLQNGEAEWRWDDETGEIVPIG